jgi:formate dehydrogenase subunit delta
MPSPDDASHNPNDKLVYMANQIGTFFRSQDLNTASAKIAEHITKFWDPRMRRAIVETLRPRP